MSLSQRSGLNLLGAGSDTVPAAHYNQNVKARTALAKVAADLFGGAGIYAGGAHVIGDFSGSGTLYPAVILVLNDDAGEVWFFKCAGPAAITFSAPAAAPAALYAVVQTMAGVAPAAAEGGATQVLFLTQDAGDDPPAHALRLGAGTVSGSAFTSWTPEPGTFVPWNPGGGSGIPPVDPAVAGHLPQLTDEGELADSGIVAADVLTALPAHATSHNAGGSDPLAGFGASGAGHQAGSVPDPGATAGTARYLREDATWHAPPGGGGGMPLIDPATDGNLPVQLADGTLSDSGIAAADVLTSLPVHGTGHVDGTDDVPVVVASGAGARKGLVPRPPTSSGSLKFLREDATWAVPPGSGDGLTQDCTVRLDPEYLGVAWIDAGGDVACQPTEGLHNLYYVAEDANVQAQVMWRVPDNFTGWRTTAIEIARQASGAAPDSTVTVYLDAVLVDTYSLSDGEGDTTAVPGADLADAVPGSLVALWFDLNGCYSGYGTNLMMLGWIDFVFEVNT